MALNQEKCHCGRTQFKCKAREVIAGQWNQNKTREKNRENKIFLFPARLWWDQSSDFCDVRLNRTISESKSVLLWPGNHDQNEVVLTHRSGFGCYQNEVNNLLSPLPPFDKRAVSCSSIDLLLHAGAEEAYSTTSKISKIVKISNYLSRLWFVVILE